MILRYHSVGEPRLVAQYLDPRLSLPTRRFQEQIRFLAGHFEVLDLDRLISTLDGGGPRRPAVVITFDDGFRDNYENAAPILADAGVPAVFYVTTSPLSSGRGLWISELWRLMPRLPPGPSGLPPDLPQEIPGNQEGKHLLRRQLTRWFAGLPEGEREAHLDHLARLARVPRGEGLAESFLTPAQLRTLREEGMTVAAHSRSHPHLERLAPRWHEEEVLGSRRDLEEIIGQPIRHFAYPNPSSGGHFTEEARASVHSAGFETAATAEARPVDFDVDRLRLPRLPVSSGAAERLLFSLLARETSRR